MRILGSELRFMKCFCNKYELRWKQLLFKAFIYNSGNFWAKKTYDNCITEPLNF